MTSSPYQELILDHYRNPRNRGVLDHPTHRSETYNPLCGDRLAMDIKVENGIIRDVRFTGSGCAISQASASLLTEKVKGVSDEVALSFVPEDILQMLGVSLSPNRLKCALLSLETLKKTLRTSGVSHS